MKVRSITMIIFCTMMQFGPVLGWGEEAQQLSGETLAVIERDTMQTRNFVPVINHEAMIVNLSKKPMTVDIISPLPPEKYIKDSPLSAFGRDSLLGAPMFSPFTVPTGGQVMLEKPDLKQEGEKVAYFWRNTILPPDVAVIAQYDNRYGAKKDFHRDYGLEIAQLQVIGNYSVKKNKDLYRLLFDITLKNQGDQPIEEFFFRIFIPTDVKPKEGDEWVTLVGSEEIWASEHINISQSTIVDGFNRTAQGIDASCQVGSISAGAIAQFIIQMDCRKKAAIGEIYPLLYLLGRQKLIRLWPETEIDPAVEPGKQKKFHYLFYNLVIPDRFIFRLTSEGIGVLPAKD